VVVSRFILRYMQVRRHGNFEPARNLTLLENFTASQLSKLR
jgi:hypothetical protein